MTHASAVARAGCRSPPRQLHGQQRRAFRGLTVLHDRTHLAKGRAQALLDPLQVALRHADHVVSEPGVAIRAQVFVRRLRTKLDPDETLKPIETLRGQGYRWTLPRK